MCGNGVQVIAFNGTVCSCSPIFSLFNPKDVLGHAVSFVPPHWHGEPYINGVCVVEAITVVVQVVEDISCGDIVLVGIGVLELDDPRLLHDSEDESA